MQLFLPLSSSFFLEVCSRDFPACSEPPHFSRLRWDGRESPPLSECEVFLSSSSHQRRSTLEGSGVGVNIWAAGCQGRRGERKGSPLYFRSPSLIPPSAAGRKEGIDLTGWTPRVPFFLSFAPHLLHTHTHSRTLLFLLPLCEIAPAARKATPATGATAPGAAVWYKIHHTASGPGRPKLASSKQKCKAGFLKQIPLGGESWLFLGRIIIPQSHIISQKSKEGGGGKGGRSSGPPPSPLQLLGNPELQYKIPLSKLFPLLSRLLFPRDTAPADPAVGHTLFFAYLGGAAEQN